MQNQQQPNINIQGQFQFKNNTEVPPKFNTNMQSQQLSNNNNVNQLQFNNNMKFQQQPNSNNILSKQIVSTPQQFSNIFQTKIQQSYPLSNESTTSTQLSIPNSIQISGTEEEEKKKKNQAELESIVSRCKIVENKNTSLKICIYPTYKESQFKDISEFKTLIMIGETGVGKSTTINFFCNYYLGVQYDYPFRFLIVNETGEEFSKSQAVSKTSKVNTYFIKSFDGKPGLRIIDTPGFADTRGQEYDEIISEQITDSLKKIDSITMICFVMRANQNRLTAPQKYVMNRLLKLFGNDVVENFIFLFTFADQDDEPQALQALLFQGDKQHSPSPVAEFIAQVRCPYWLQFNNSAFLSGRKDSLLWDIACAQYKIFYEQKILLTQFVSLKLTKEVIFERKQLQNLIKNLRPELQKQLNLIGDIQNQVDNIKKLSQEELQSQNYKFSQKGYEIVKVNLNQNEYVTNCIKCNHTCHYPCCYRNSEDKKKCCAMSNGQCTVCKGKCNWQDHENMTFRFEVKEKITEVVMEDLKKRHQKSSSLKLDKEDILKGLKLDLQKNQIICQDQIKALLKSVNKLNEIALQPAISDCESEYIDCLINEEQQNCQAGYKERIKNLQNIKAEWDLLKKQVAK